MIPDGLVTGWIIYTLKIHTMSYTGEFEQVLNFYKNTNATQHQMYLRLIADKVTLFNSETKESLEIDPEYDISFNGIYHQINVK